MFCTCTFIISQELLNKPLADIFLIFSSLVSATLCKHNSVVNSWASEGNTINLPYGSL